MGAEVGVPGSSLGRLAPKRLPQTPSPSLRPPVHRKLTLTANLAQVGLRGGPGLPAGEAESRAGAGSWEGAAGEGAS